jgi:hypothetical protein
VEDQKTQTNTKVDGSEANSVSIFQHNEKDIKTEYFLERAKKMATAIYIVTNLMPQTDPLRLSIRKYSIRLLSFMGTKMINFSPKEISGEVTSISKKISAMLEIAFFSGYISEMNFSVLKTELDIFTSEIAGYEGSQKTIEQSMLKGEALPSPVLTYMNPNRGLGANHKGHKVSQTGSNVRGVYKEKLRIQKASENRGVVEAKKTSRKESILSIIKLKGSVSIKDISSVVVNCSEKTIQRELITLVADGILKKSGDRRWSTYSLVG